MTRAAKIDARREDWRTVHEHLLCSLAADADNLNARNLLVLTLRKLNRFDDAARLHLEIRAVDPLDLASRFRDGIDPANGRESLDLAFDLLRSGQREEAARALRSVSATERDGSLPMVLLLLAQIETDIGSAHAEATWARAHAAPLEYCFPSLLDEMLLLQTAIAAHPHQAGPYYLLGNLLYDRRRHDEAIQAWEIAANLTPSFATVWRNLGIAVFNVRGDAEGAKRAFDRAIQANPKDGRVIFERDQLWKRTGENPATRMAELQKHRALIEQRDDLSVELATLYNQLGEPDKALDLLLTRQFQPWEGGEGLVLAQYVRAQLLLGRRALERLDPARALEHFMGALQVPENLGEAHHLLADRSDIYYWIGKVYDALGDPANASCWWKRATHQRGETQQGPLQRISDKSYWSGMAQLDLGARDQAANIFQQIYEYSIELEQAEPRIDYFATSLPAFLLFEDDLEGRNRAESRFLRAEALSGFGRNSEAVSLLTEVLAIDTNHAGAADLLHQIKRATREERQQCS